MQRLLILIGTILIPTVTLAQKPIELLEPLPGLTEITFSTAFPLDVLNAYLQPFLPLAFGMGAGLAVMMVIIGGFQIMLSGGGEAMKAGKERIMYAIGGLFILVLSALILNMLNANFFHMIP